ncbi:hypothetical protein DPMN_053602 [Dreissena polymorpha]|uniref:G-protein coupled receptors family 1 profile domain-containing protein n=1 Tax=Dreissena polymorpha TaxID=45954 RepID=A0A9D4HNZ8_DREPO|nr:hypothetical protein DPMN_053602 [Dreissena polymorpha]
MDNTTFNTSDSNHGHERISETQLIVIKTFAISTSILGSFANAVTIAAIIRRKLHSQATFLKILNLLVCNLVHSAIFLPLIAVQAFTGFWTDKSAICIAVSFGVFCNLGTELFGYVCISLNRYFCIVNRKWKDALFGNKKKLALQLFISWSIYPIILTFPLFGFWSHYEYAPKKLLCHPFLGLDCDSYCLFVFLFATLTTMPVISYCYLRIIIVYYKVKRNLLKVRESMARPGSTGVSTVTKQTSDNVLKRSELKMAFTILAVILCFGFFRVPFILLYMYDPSITKVDSLIHTIIIYVGSILNWVNPIIYAMTNRKIREAIRSMIKEFADNVFIK